MFFYHMKPGGMADGTRHCAGFVVVDWLPKPCEERAWLIRWEIDLMKARL
jgi:hypothetical protein